MNTRILMLLSAGLMVALAACGGGSVVGTGSPSDALNAAELELLGTYALLDVELYDETSTAGTLETRDFDVAEGTLVLSEDRQARVEIELCEEPGVDALGCSRLYEWRADAGVLYLEPLDAAAPDVRLAWAWGTSRRLLTEPYVPSNHPECGFLVVSCGREHFEWTEVEAP